MYILIHPDISAQFQPPFRLWATRFLHLHNSGRERAATIGTGVKRKGCEFAFALAVSPCRFSQESLCHHLTRHISNHRCFFFLSHLRVNLQQSDQTLALSAGTHGGTSWRKRERRSSECAPCPGGVDMSKLMSGAGVTELMREENNWTKRYSPLEKIMAQIPLTANWKDYLMAFSHLKVAAPKLTVFVALPIIHLVIFLIDRSATKTLQEAISPHTWLIWSCCSLFDSRFYTQHGIVSCPYPNEFILAVAQHEWMCTWRSLSSSIWKTFRNIWISHPGG